MTRSFGISAARRPWCRPPRPASRPSWRWLTVFSRLVIGTGGATCNLIWERLEKNKQYAAPELQVFGRKFGLPLSGSKFHLPMASKD